jgi:cysteine dioxygenase
MNRTLERLFQYLDGLRQRPLLAELTAQVSELDIGCSDVAEAVRFSERHYMRNLLRAGPWYYVLVLCWRNGQRSPIHDHAGSACCVRVLHGILTETVFEFAANGDVKAKGSCDFPPGSVIGSEDHYLHQVSNLQEGNEDLVTLHVYSPPLLRMGTYSLTDRTRGWEPMFIEYAEAAGI